MFFEIAFGGTSRRGLCQPRGIFCYIYISGVRLVTFLYQVIARGYEVNRRWNEAANRIGHEWLKAGDTKSGKRQAHTAQAFVELNVAVNAAQSAHAAAAPQPQITT